MSIYFDSFQESSNAHSDSDDVSILSNFKFHFLGGWNYLAIIARNVSSHSSLTNSEVSYSVV